MIECLKNYGWRFVILYRRQGSRPCPRKRNTKRQNGCLGRPYKGLTAEKNREAQEKGAKERYAHLNAEFQRIAREIRKPSSVIDAKEKRKTIEWERIEISSRK